MSSSGEYFRAPILLWLGFVLFIGDSTYARAQAAPPDAGKYIYRCTFKKSFGEESYTGTHPVDSDRPVVVIYTVSTRSMQFSVNQGGRLYPPIPLAGYDGKYLVLYQTLDVYSAIRLSDGKFVRLARQEAGGYVVFEGSCTKRPGLSGRINLSMTP